MKKNWRFFANKYILTGIAFVVWMTFFDQNDWQSLRKKKQELSELQSDLAFLNHEIARMERAHEALKNDPKTLEQYAREHYRMKRDNEDVYVIEKN